MKTILALFILVTSFTEVLSQTFITGTVSDKDGQAVTGANITLKNTYDGVSTDTTGYFIFKTTETGKQTLVISFIGYETMEREIDLTSKVESLKITLRETSNELKTVVISAGTFATSEVDQPVVLKPMDIATTPSAVGDIYGALTTLPGAQIVGNEGGLYVRGGEGYETKTFIDGMLVANPYMSKMPDLPTRGRFSPLLFTGTAFSSGCYSAEYGQALSSALNLSTVGLAPAEQTTISLLSVGFSSSHTQRWDKTSVAATFDFYDMTLYNKLQKQTMDWQRAPVQSGGTVLFRHRFGKYGLLKVFGASNFNHSALKYSLTGSENDYSLIDLRFNNNYLQAVYSDQLSKSLQIKSGLSYSYDKNKTGIDANRLTDGTVSLHHRTSFAYEANKIVSVKFGGELALYRFDQTYYAADSLKKYMWDFNLFSAAQFVESEFHLNDKFVARTGIRSEYASLRKEWQVEPRLSLAYKLGNFSQLSAGYGQFHQRAENRYLLYNNNLKPEKATHFILNYQYERDERILRIEFYKKQYSELVKYQNLYATNSDDFNNDGNGYAKGIDFFWRDSKTIKGLDYWISYSYIDTKRNYQRFNTALTPSFISPHTFSSVFKYFAQNINTYISVTYMCASAKTYYNPYIEVLSGDKTKAFNDLSLNITHILPLRKSYLAILININNLFGFQNVYGYNYTANSSLDGNYSRFPIKPQTKRFFVVGAFITFQ